MTVRASMAASAAIALDPGLPDVVDAPIAPETLATPAEGLDPRAGERWDVVIVPAHRRFYTNRHSKCHGK